MNQQLSAEKVLSNANVIVTKIGGDNASEFQQNADIAQQTPRKQKQIFVFSAIRSSDEQYSGHAIVRDKLNNKEKSGFNTTSHLISVARKLQEGNPDDAKFYLDAVKDFIKAIITDKVEPRFQAALRVFAESEIESFWEKIAAGSAKNIHQIGEDWVCQRADNNYLSISGFGETLTRKLYSEYFELKSIKAAQFDEETRFGNAIYNNNSGKVSDKENGQEDAKIEEIKDMIRTKLADALKYNNIIVTGGHLPVVASSRGYGDVTGEVFAEIVDEDRFRVVYQIAKLDPIKSIDPKTKTRKKIRDKVVRIMGPKMAAELFEHLGANAGAVHPNALKRLQRKPNIHTVVRNPADPERGATLITNQHKPKRGSVEVVAHRILGAPLQISGIDMPGRKGVVAFITEYFKDVSIDQIYTTGGFIYFTFNEAIDRERVRILNRKISARFGPSYQVELKKDLAIIFCVGNTFNALKETGKASTALAKAGIEADAGSFVKDAATFTYVVPASDAERAVATLHNVLIS